MMPPPPGTSQCSPILPSNLRSLPPSLLPSPSRKRRMYLFAMCDGEGVASLLSLAKVSRADLRSGDESAPCHLQTLPRPPVSCVQTLPLFHSHTASCSYPS